jgi:hypothetical protein
MINVCKILIEKRERRHSMKDLGVSGRIALKWGLNIQVERLCGLDSSGLG